MEKLKAIIKQTILNLKYIISTPSSIVLLLFVSFTPYSIALFFLPLRYSFSILILMAVVLPTGIVYISTSFNIREGTIYKNLAITKNNKMEFYISGFICMVIVGMCLLVFTYILLMILSELNLLITDYWWDDTEMFKYAIYKIPFIPLLYSVFESILILFSTCFFFQNLITNKKNMYIFIFSLMLLTVVFGGSFNNYYMQAQVDPTTTGIAIPMYHAMMFPGSVYYISLLFPFFGPSQHLASLGGTFTYYVQYDIFVNISNNDYRFFVWLSNSNSINTNLQNTGWNILWFAPIFWTGLFGTLGTITSKLKFSF